MDIQYVVASDYNQTVRQRLKTKHQASFDESVHNKLRQIQPSINYNSKIGVYSRKDEMVVTRLKIGHTYLTNGYLLRGEDPPYCHADECDITVMVKIPTRTHVRDTFDSHERLHGRDRRAPLAPDYLPMETGMRVELSRTCVRVYFCYTRSYETI